MMTGVGAAPGPDATNTRNPPLNLLDKLFGPPTLERVAGQLLKALRARGFTQLELNLERAEIVATRDEGPMRIYLGNLLHDYRQSPRAARQAVLDRFIDGMLPEDTAIPDAYIDARSRLVPVVRSTADIGIAVLSMARSLSPEDQAAAQAATPVHRPLAADLVVALVCDLPNSMAYVVEQQLVKWGVDFDQALGDALDNLRGLPEHGGWKPLAPGLWSGEWGDSYESSRILLPDLIHRVGVSQPVVFMPFRNTLLLGGATDPAAMAAMARVAELGLDDNRRWLSFQPLRLHERQWVPHLPPEPAAEMLRVLQLRNQAGSYASQKDLLDALHQGAGIDLFVASYQLMQRGDAAPHSFAVWADQVDTLLPVPELLAFSYQDGEAARHVLVPWAQAEPLVRELLEATEHQPPRLRARRFPDASVLRQLAEVAIPLGG